MTNALYQIGKGSIPQSSDINQILGMFSGTTDPGTLTITGPSASPTTALATAVGIAGNLTGAYGYVVTYITGTMQSNGSVIINGETTVGPVSASVTASSQTINLSSLPIPAAPVIGRRIYRNKSTGSATAGPFYLLTQINDITTTMFLDNIPDANLGALAPTSNTTGSVIQLPNMTSFPVTPQIGVLAFVNGILYYYSGTAWIQIAASTGTQTFTSSGTFSVPAGVNRVFVLCVGGGGGGGVYNSTEVGTSGTYTTIALGGGGGGAVSGWIDVTPGQNIAVTVGSGGAGGVFGGAVPGNGGSSSFGGFLTATGGTGGNGSTSGTGGNGVGGSYTPTNNTAIQWAQGYSGGSAGSGCYTSAAPNATVISTSQNGATFYYIGENGASSFTLPLNASPGIGGKTSYYYSTSFTNTTGYYGGGGSGWQGNGGSYVNVSTSATSANGIAPGGGGGGNAYDGAGATGGNGAAGAVYIMW